MPDNRTLSIDLQKYLIGLNYPAKKSELVKVARKNEAPEGVIAKIQHLPQGEYLKAADIMDDYNTLAIRTRS